MLRLIYKQLWNRRKSNGWILIELLLVFCLLWYLVDYLFVLGCNYMLPSYRDTDHTWQVTLAQYPEGHPEYVAAESEPDMLEANYARILNHIRSYPGVEAIGISFNSSTPGHMGFMGTTYCNANDTTLESPVQLFTISPTEDYFKVFAYTTDNGDTPLSNSDFNWSDPKALLLSRQAADKIFPDGNTVGGRLASRWDPEVDLLVIGVVDDVKRFATYRPTPAVYQQRRLDAESIQDAEISLRASASIPDMRFYETFYWDMTNALRIGNFYLQSVSSYNDIQAEADVSYGNANDRRVRISMMLFFILNLLLCVIGTFWYRINVRREEIGLRVALGSSRREIIRLFTLEGLCLLSIVTLPAMLIEYQFVHAGLIETVGVETSAITFLPDRTLLRFLITNAITWCLLAITVIAAIWLPATKAANMQAAEALHYE